MDFLQELDQLINAPQEESDVTTEQVNTNTQLTNPEEYDWHQTAAEQQDYQALNQEIERDRFIQKTTVTISSGLTTLGGGAALGNWVLETTYNPQGYLIFSGVITAAILSGGLSGSRMENKKFYSSPWLLSSVGASMGIVGGAYFVCKPYFNDRNIATKGHTAMTAEIKAIEVKPQTATNNIPLMAFGVVGILAIAIMFLKR